MGMNVADEKSSEFADRECRLETHPVSETPMLLPSQTDIARQHSNPDIDSE